MRRAIVIMIAALLTVDRSSAELELLFLRGQPSRTSRTALSKALRRNSGRFTPLR